MFASDWMWGQPSTPPQYREATPPQYQDASSDHKKDDDDDVSNKDKQEDGDQVNTKVLCCIIPKYVDVSSFTTLEYVFNKHLTILHIS